MKRIAIIILMISTLLSQWQGKACGPLFLDNAGSFYTYGNSPLIYRYDPGALGKFSNSEAIAFIEPLLDEWENVSTATLQLTRDNPGSLPFDINLITFLPIIATPKPLGFTPIIFDNNGSIVDALLGLGSRNQVIGFAAPAFATNDNGELKIIESQALFNGRFIDGVDTVFNPELSTNAYKSAIKHEFGHAIGLDHSQINLEALKPDASQELKDSVPLMFPFSVNDKSSLKRDDISGVSFLYPKSDQLNNLGIIQGKVLKQNGLDPVLGANVIARNINNPTAEAISCVSDFLTNKTGSFTLFAVPPGDYRIEIEPIHQTFYGGSSVGPYSNDPNSLSFQNPVPKGYYTGSNQPITSSQEQAFIVSVLGGQTIKDINIVATLTTKILNTSSSSSSSSSGSTILLPSSSSSSSGSTIALPSSSSSSSSGSTITLSSSSSSSSSGSIITLSSSSSSSSSGSTIILPSSSSSSSSGSTITLPSSSSSSSSGSNGLPLPSPPQSSPVSIPITPPTSAPAILPIVSPVPTLPPITTYSPIPISPPQIPLSLPPQLPVPLPVESLPVIIPTITPTPTPIQTPQPLIPTTQTSPTKEPVTSSNTSTVPISETKPSPVFNQSKKLEVIKSLELPAPQNTNSLSLDKLPILVTYVGSNPSFQIKLPKDVDIVSVSLKDFKNHIVESIKYSAIQNKTKNKAIITLNIPDFTSIGKAELTLNLSNGLKLIGEINIISFVDFSNIGTDRSTKSRLASTPTINKIVSGMVGNTSTITIKGNDFASNRIRILKNNTETSVNSTNNIFTTVSIFSNDSELNPTIKSISRNGKDLIIKLDDNNSLNNQSEAVIVISTPRGIVSVPLTINN